MLPVYNIQLKNIGSAKCVVCVTNPTVVGLLSHQPITLPVPPAHYVTVPLVCVRLICCQSTRGLLIASVTLHTTLDTMPPIHDLAVCGRKQIHSE